MEELIKELEKIDNKEEKCLFVLGNEFSVNEIINHLRKNTEVGNEFYHMHLKLKEKMGKIRLPD